MLAGMLAGAACGTSAAADPGGTMVCSASPCIVGSAPGTTADGLRVMGSTGPGLQHVLNVTDWQGNTQFMVNVGQVATGDLPLCITGDQYNIEACLSPGTWDAAAGQYRGAPFLSIGGQVLTAADIDWIHDHGG